MLNYIQSHINNASSFAYDDEQRITSFYLSISILESAIESNSDPRLKKALDRLLLYHPNKEYMQDNLYIEFEDAFKKAKDDFIKDNNHHGNLSMLEAKEIEDKVRSDFYDLSDNLNFLGSDDILREFKC